MSAQHAMPTQSGPDPAVHRLPKLLIKLRDRVGWSQADLAEAIGVDPSLISRIETGATRRPQRRTLMKIADAFREAGLPVDVRHLEAAVDAGLPAGAYELDERLLRIHDAVSTYPPEVQDVYYDTLYAAFRLLEVAHQTGRYGD